MYDRICYIDSHPRKRRATLDVINDAFFTLDLRTPRNFWVRGGFGVFNFGIALSVFYWPDTRGGPV